MVLILPIFFIFYVFLDSRNDSRIDIYFSRNEYLWGTPFDTLKTRNEYQYDHHFMLAGLSNSAQLTQKKYSTQTVFSYIQPTTMSNSFKSYIKILLYYILIIV